MSNDRSADRFAVQDVMSSYACGVDERDMTMYANCFADDVEVVGFGAETVHGKKAWVDYVIGALERFGPTQHMLGPQLVRFEGPDRAHCRTDVQALHYLKEPAGQILTLWATYNSDMVRTPDGWKIKRHQLTSRGTRVW
jgi:hypothetical protein